MDEETKETAEKLRNLLQKSNFIDEYEGFLGMSRHPMAWILYLALVKFLDDYV